MTVEVLHVIARMNVGGTARYVGDLVQNIPNSLLATGYVQGGEIEDAVVSKLPKLRIEHLGRKISLRNDFMSFLELKRTIKEVNPKILHTHTFKAGLIGRIIPGQHKRVHTFHGHLFEDSSFNNLEKFAIKIIERFLAKRTDVLISVGNRVGIEIRQLKIGVNRRWYSIPPGVKSLNLVERTLARKKLNLENNAFYFGWMARMAPVKDPNLLLQIAKKLPKYNFVMAGGGELLNQIRQIAPKNVIVIGWSDASVFWSAIDCAISTSENEGMPIALIEAQLSGIPVIATNVGSNSEVIKSSITGFIVKNNLDDLVNAVREIYANQTRFRFMQESAKKWAKLEFNTKKMIQNHKEMYNEVNSGSQI